MLRSRRVHAALVSVVAIVSLGLVAVAQGAKSDVTDVTIAFVSPTGTCVPLQIALDQNLFPSNIHVTAKLLPGSSILAPLATGNVDLALVGSPIVDLGVASSGAPLKYLAEWSDPPDSELVVRPEIKKFTDLQGKSIGASAAGTLSALLAQAAMHLGGMNSGWNLVPLGAQQNSVAAFSNGTVAGFIAGPPTTQQLESLVPGAHVLFDFFAYKKFKWLGMGLAGYMPWVTKHPGATVAVIKALNQALNTIQTNPAATKASLQKLTGLTNQADIDSSYTSLKGRTTKTVMPVNVATVANVLWWLRQNQTPQAKASLAKQLVNNSYVNQVLHPKKKRK